MNQEWANIGQILKPQGLKGMLKIKYESSIPLSQGDKVKISEQEYTVTSWTMRNDGSTFIELKGIDSIEKAEKLKSSDLYIQKDNLPSGEYEIKDLIGLEVISEQGEDIGILKSLLNLPQQPVMEIKSQEHGIFLMPFLEPEFIVSIDLTAKTITVKGWENFLDSE